jgi:hypothetical protein
MSLSVSRNRSLSFFSAMGLRLGPIQPGVTGEVPFEVQVKLSLRPDTYALQFFPPLASHFFSRLRVSPGDLDKSFQLRR